MYFFKILVNLEARAELAFKVVDSIITRPRREGPAACGAGRQDLLEGKT